MHPVGILWNLQTDFLQVFLDAELSAIVQFLTELATVVCWDAQLLIDHDARIGRDELVLVPFGRLDWGLKKDAALVIPFSEIMDVEIKEAALNYHITIRTEKDVITLSAQQKELSALRSSGMLGGSLTEGNWHSENLDSTLQMLQEIAGH